MFEIIQLKELVIKTSNFITKCRISSVKDDSLKSWHCFMFKISVFITKEIKRDK